MKFLIVLAASAFVIGVSAQEPTTDAPLATSPPSPFTCLGRPPGYYADVHTGCRSYHVCDGVSHFTYICPRRTLFQQKTRICDHEYRVRCFREDAGQEEDDFFLGLTDTEDSTYDTGYSEDDYDQTEEYTPTETTPFEAYKRTEIPTTILTTPASTIRTKPPTAAATSKTTTTTTVTTEATTVSLEEDSPFHKVLKFRLKDFRSLFFIPEFQNNSILAQPEKELILPVDKGDLMIFKNRRGSRRSSSSPCPSYCNPKFFLQGTCHPCIMIK